MGVAISPPSTPLANVEVRWANSAPEDTARTITLPAANKVVRGTNAALLVIVNNPSSVTDIDVVVEVGYPDGEGGATRWAELTSFAVRRSFAPARLVDGGLLGAAVRLRVSNATVLGGADTFRARFVVYGF